MKGTVVFPTPVRPITLPYVIKKQARASNSRYLRDIYNVGRCFLSSGKLELNFGPKIYSYRCLVISGGGTKKSLSVKTSTCDKNALHRIPFAKKRHSRPKGIGLYLILRIVVAHDLYIILAATKIDMTIGGHREAPRANLQADCDHHKTYEIGAEIVIDSLVLFGFHPCSQHVAH